MCYTAYSQSSETQISELFLQCVHLYEPFEWTDLLEWISFGSATYERKDCLELVDSLEWIGLSNNI